MSGIKPSKNALKSLPSGRRMPENELTEAQKWRVDTDNTLKKLAEKRHQISGYMRAAMYKELEVRTGCNTDLLLANIRQKSVTEGNKAMDTWRLTKLDAIAEDEALRKAFDTVIADWS